MAQLPLRALVEHLDIAAAYVYEDVGVDLSVPMRSNTQ